MLVGPIFLVLVGLSAAGYLSQVASAHRNGQWVLFIWLAWFVLLLRLVWKLFDWSVEYLFVTSDRIILISGILRRKIATIWLAQVTAIEIRHTVRGRRLGYAELVFHSPCPDAALLAFDYAPYPDVLAEELREVVFPGWIPRPN